ncbi:MULTISPECIES: lysylphosphatidylglycerol synthase transmembrane domain-containing protein [Anaerolinea]|uniref:lysylphosphatidylglycerol synthase transmembrane domain-containing protein n=1 Tax=Anaerolinea TaxID=233189 RepID=UPI00262CAD81|nr:lysylphosphatidylglycerol synthase transmembrane domain-containing protein [Anaerolinea thermophila]
MKVPRSKATWIRWAGTLLTLILLGYLATQQDWEVLRASFQQIEPWRWLAALGLTLLSRLAVTLRWHVLLASAQPRMRFSQSLRLTFAGLFAANFLPTTVGGDAVRLVGAIQLRMDAALSTASLVADRLIGMAGMTLALPWGLARALDAGLPVLAGAILPFPALVQKVRVFLSHLMEHFRFWVHKPVTLVSSLGFTFVHMVCLFTSIDILLAGQRQSINWLTIAGIWSLVYFITLLPVSINGLGLQEVSSTLLYAHLGGISMEASLTLAVLLRALQMLASLPGALFVPGILAAREDAQK